MLNMLSVGSWSRIVMPAGVHGVIRRLGSNDAATNVVGGCVAAQGRF